MPKKTEEKAVLEKHNEDKSLPDQKQEEETEKAKDPKIFFGRSTKENQVESKSKIKAPTVFPIVKSA